MLFLAIEVQDSDDGEHEQVIGIFDSRAGAYERLVREGSLYAYSWRIREVELNGALDDGHDEEIEVPLLVEVRGKPVGGTIDVAALNAVFKQVYATQVRDLLPDCDLLRRLYR